MVFITLQVIWMYFNVETHLVLSKLIRFNLLKVVLKQKVLSMSTFEHQSLLILLASCNLLNLTIGH